MPPQDKTRAGLPLFHSGVEEWLPRSASALYPQPNPTSSDYARGYRNIFDQSLKGRQERTERKEENMPTPPSSSVVTPQGGGGLPFKMPSWGKDAANWASVLLPLLGGGRDQSAYQMSPEMQQSLNQLLQMQMQRLQNLDPLQQAVALMAMGRLPTRYQQPINWGGPGGAGGGLESGAASAGRPNAASIARDERADVVDPNMQAPSRRMSQADPYRRYEQILNRHWGRG